MIRRFSFALTALLIAAPLTPAQEKRQLEHEDYDRWTRIVGEQISDDGRWIEYTLSPGGDEDSTLVFRRVEGEREHRITRGASAQFSKDGKHALYLVRPDPEVIKQQRKDKVKSDEQDKSALEILNLATGETVRIERVRSFSLPAEAGGVVAIYMEKPLPPKKDKEAEKGEVEKGEGEKAEGEKSGEAGEPEGEVKPEPEAKGEPAKAEEKKAEPEPKAEPEKKPEPEKKAETTPEEEKKQGAEEKEKKKEKKKDPGTELVLRRLGSGEEQRFENVTSFAFTENGDHLAFATSAKEAEKDGVFVVQIASGEVTPVMTGRGHYKSLEWTEAGDRLAFLTDRDDYEADKPSWSVMDWRAGASEAAVAAREGMDGIPEGWWIADSRGPSFNKPGERLFFETQPRPEPEPEKDEDAEDEPEVKVDIWHWQDDRMMPQQLLQAGRDRNRTYQAVRHADGTIVQLEDEELGGVNLGRDRVLDIGVANDDAPYQLQSSWGAGRDDIYLVDARTGEAEMIVEGNPTGGGSLSPNGKYVTWWNGEKKAWFSHNIETGKQTNLSGAIPHPVYNELDDRPAFPRSYGSAGWTDDDAAILLYDMYDIWAVDPAGFWPPTCVTEGKGREMGVRFRYTRLDREAQTIDPAAPMLLSAFHLTEKSSGVYRDRIRDGGEPERIIMLDERLSSPDKAEDADTVIFTRQTFEMYPDLWASTLSDDLQMGEMTRLTDANPQQAEYTWGTAELHEWSSLDGNRLQGILYKPEGFDPEKQYPMMVYFYERLSDRLHSYVTPAPGSSSINTSFYVSRGYIVFQPDIPYREGYPGQSAVNAILPGVTSLIEAGFVDPDRIGVQGHSWGGYQSAFLITVTDMFAACESGAPVSNMTSAYGGIRWGSGLVRQFQYEQTQSRIGGTLWERPTQYIENSPLFRADKINTPLLILHNDEDGAVPWYQGIELFAAMRRLGKPAWMFNYNGEAHGLRQEHNRKDWTIRMQQFFDHYLKDAPPPVWLVEGVPAVEKGRTLGLDLIEADKK